MDKLLAFIKKEPFSLKQKDKEKIFLPILWEAARWQYQHCPELKKLYDNRNFKVFKKFKLFDLPYLPTSIFKKFDLLSVPKNRLIKTLYSSSTSGLPSKIMIDKISADRQVLALNKIMSSFLGKDRRLFIIFDTEETIKSVGGELSSRGTAIRGLFSMAKKTSFILNKSLSVNIEKLKHLLSSLNGADKICFFGFSWLIYSLHLEKNKKLSSLFRKIPNQDKLVLHIGGWKKLKDLAVSKEDFNKLVEKALGIKRGKIIDFYGLTEQLGTVYPDCEFGYKHLPLYSEMIVRKIDTLKPADIGQAGLIQFLSPLPHSYPGISILTDDIGRIMGIDDCKCGRKGKYFAFEKRSEEAELRGCGDTLKD
ncbi:hypothetical protein A2160_02585 [Candidatus Beckwithbacteria bacterium RBG_13_42_9]|uniref:Acyl-protein synthetase LuxE domain-containing protein n=1 Tax=Candidatus Beckwithbacteria bacterium RBG_13_42_9 TaxID=1797457 RepID=A0A1F5E7K2_9BACT|nr:MAG: hypothetical protein A2160_02585 [Candidatus Beckwithbacteria bacterium RBG_13_42_9]